VREQVEWMPRSLDSLLAQDHPARAIWAMLQQLDLSGFYADVKSVEGQAGRPASDPQVLLALWLLATTEGVGSARQLDRLCQEHDAYRWLRGGVPVDYHLLSDFRVNHQQELDELLTQMVGSMMAEGLVSLEGVAQDGMRTGASAGASSFRREERLEECLVQAREQVERLAQEREHPDPGVSRRQQAARERAAWERQGRVEAALAHLPEAKAIKERQRKSLAKDKREKVTAPRVSTTDAEARVMKMPGGGFQPALNLEVATDVGSQVIVGVGVTNQGNDGGQAVPMVAPVQARTHQFPGRYLMDGDFATREAVTTVESQGIAVYAPTQSPRTKTGGRSRGDPRRDDTPEVAAWRARMETEEAKQIYKERAATAECVNAHLRRYGLCRLLVRGIHKALSVLLLVAIAHDLLRWIALRG
jgi:transposase